MDSCEAGTDQPDARLSDRGYRGSARVQVPGGQTECPAQSMTVEVVSLAKLSSCPSGQAFPDRAQAPALWSRSPGHGARPGWSTCHRRNRHLSRLGPSAFVAGTTRETRSSGRETFVTVMEATDFGDLPDLAHARRLDVSGLRRVRHSLRLEADSSSPSSVTPATSGCARHRPGYRWTASWRALGREDRATCGSVLIRSGRSATGPSARHWPARSPEKRLRVHLA